MSEKLIHPGFMCADFYVGSNGLRSEPLLNRAPFGRAPFLEVFPCRVLVIFGIEIF
jgi:hypothetical protein